MKNKIPSRRTVVHFSLVLFLIWLCRRTTTDADINELKYDGSNLPKNVNRAYLGQIFFHRLIHDNDSYELVNEENMCSLIHFFIQQATLNNRPVQFKSGTFVLYDSTRRLFPRLMMAKNTQIHSDEHRSGYYHRLKYFVVDALLWICQRVLGHRQSISSPFIYLRGDESSHFHERGTQHERWHDYPAYGLDIPHGCLPNHFGHILFGRLKSLSDTVDPEYQGDRIYFKPEEYGLQKFSHYVAHANHYFRSKLHLYSCRWINRWNRKWCFRDGVFHEWTDRVWIKRWDHILSTLTHVDGRQLHEQAFVNGLHEIYRQTLLFSSWPHVGKFRNELELYYGSDISARKGNEVILTTKQLLNNRNVALS